MGSYQFLHRPYQVRGSCCSTDIRRGFSKSQMCLQKILRIIASYPPHETSRKSSLNREILEFEENKKLGIDLNMEFCPWQASECLSSCSLVDKVFSNCTEVEFGGVFAAEKSSSEGECDPKEAGDQLGTDTDSPTIEAIGKESGRLEVSETTNLDSKDVKQEEKEKQESLDHGDDREVKLKKLPPFEEKEEEKRDKNGCISLLIEAADMVSGSSEDKEDLNASSSSSKRNSEMGDTCPVGRTKRGRSQVLPLRYRDSVLLLPPRKRVARLQTPAAAAMVSTKRGRSKNNKSHK